MYSIWFTKIEPSGRLNSALLTLSTLSRFIPGIEEWVHNLDQGLDGLAGWFSRCSSLLRWGCRWGCDVRPWAGHQHRLPCILRFDVCAAWLSTRHFEEWSKGGIQGHSASAPSTMNQRLAWKWLWNRWASLSWDMNSSSRSCWSLSFCHSRGASLAFFACQTVLGLTVFIFTKIGGGVTRTVSSWRMSALGTALVMSMLDHVVSCALAKLSINCKSGASRLVVVVERSPHAAKLPPITSRL